MQELIEVCDGTALFKTDLFGRRQSSYASLCCWTMLVSVPDERGNVLKAWNGRAESESQWDVENV